jgi:hypothetical protein
MLASCGDQEDHASLTKDTKRGLRSKTKIADKNNKRSIKRRIARLKHKTLGWTKSQQLPKTHSASAQEPKLTTTKKLGKELRIATLNIKGANELGIREETDPWMEEDKIDILLLQQETKSPQNKREIRQNTDGTSVETTKADSTMA